VVLDASEGRVLGSSPLRCHAAGSHPIAHPDGRHVGLSVGEGQDGAEVYWGHWQDDRPVVVRLDDRSRVLIDVRPSGGEYLTTPHTSSEGSIAVHAFPSGRVVASLPASAVLEQDDWFDFTAGYVTDEMVLVASVERQEHFLLGATLAPLGVVGYPPGHPKECITPSGKGTWMTSDFLSGRHDLWRLSEDE
jgi:hypothetical protein